MGLKWFASGAEPGENPPLEVAPACCTSAARQLRPPCIGAWQLACLAAIPVLAASCLLGTSEWAAFGMNALALVVLPAAVTWGLLRLCRQILPHNFFIFIYLNAYLAAACAMALATLATASVLALAGTDMTGTLWRDHLMFLPLFALAEGFINGIVLTVLVATRPRWVWTFDEARYFA